MIAGASTTVRAIWQDGESGLDDDELEYYRRIALLEIGEDDESADGEPAAPTAPSAPRTWDELERLRRQLKRK